MRSIRHRPETWLAALAIVVIAPLSACGSSADGDSGDSRAGQADLGGGEATVEVIDEPDAAAFASDTAAERGLPAGFPDVVPLPEGSTVVREGLVTERLTQVYVDIGAQDQQDALERYARRLESDGFEVDADTEEWFQMFSPEWIVIADVRESPIGPTEMRVDVMLAEDLVL